MILFRISEFDIRIYIIVFFKEMFRPVGSLIGNLHLHTKSKDAIFALKVKKVAKDAIEKICGDLPQEAISQIKVKSFRNGQLTVLAPTLVAVELKMRSEGLKDQINKAFGKEIVSRIIFRAS